MLDVSKCNATTSVAPHYRKVLRWIACSAILVVSLWIVGIGLHFLDGAAARGLRTLYSYCLCALVFVQYLTLKALPSERLPASIARVFLVTSLVGAAIATWFHVVGPLVS